MPWNRGAGHAWATPALGLVGKFLFRSSACAPFAGASLLRKHPIYQLINNWYQLISMVFSSSLHQVSWSSIGSLAWMIVKIGKNAQLQATPLKEFVSCLKMDSQDQRCIDSQAKCRHTLCLSHYFSKQNVRFIMFLIPVRLPHEVAKRIGLTQWLNWASLRLS